MARPNREINVHYHFFEIQAIKVKDSIGLITQKDSLNDNDIQAIKTLIEVYKDLSNPNKEIGQQSLAGCNNTCHQAGIRK